MLRLQAIGWLILASSFAAVCEDYAVFESQELRCIIGNNAEMDQHRAGYNGVFELTSVHQSENVFVPAYAGLNLEHIFHTHINREDRIEFFEPRHAPMQLTRLDKRTARLYQPATPFTHVESTVVFRLADPYYLDMEYTCTPSRNAFADGAFGIFWASYIHAPEDKSLYFPKGNPDAPAVWQQFCTQYHNHDSTVRGFQDVFRWNFPDAFLNQTLFSSFSQVTYRDPFFYGRFKNMVLIYLFDSEERIRFAHSPSGGGATPSGEDTNPAWDFQMIVPQAEAGKAYRLRMRLVYKPWVDRDDVWNQYRRFQAGLSRKRDGD